MKTCLSDHRCSKLLIYNLPSRGEETVMCSGSGCESATREHKSKQPSSGPLPGKAPYDNRTGFNHCYISAWEGLYTKEPYVSRGINHKTHTCKKQKTYILINQDIFHSYKKRPVFYLHIHIYPCDLETPAIAADMQGPLHVVIMFCVQEGFMKQRTPLLMESHWILTTHSLTSKNFANIMAGMSSMFHFFIFVHS